MQDLSSFEAISRFTQALSAALHERDPYTRLHCGRVDVLVCELGAACGISASDICTLRISATLHDLGKIGISDSTLFKPAALDHDEWEEMKTHSARGQRIVCATGLAGAQDIGLIIRHHHEHVDGAGYPDGLAGESIPVLSRILALADSYDAMATPRVYHRAKPHAEVMKVMRSEVSTKFDSLLFHKFSELIERSSSRAPL